MNIIENIKEVIGPISLEEVFVLGVGFLFFFLWLFRTSFGVRALDDSSPRRNNMPTLLPFVLFLLIFSVLGIVNYEASELFKKFPDWQPEILIRLTNLITALVAICIILFTARKFFARGLKGFGFNLKTVPKDFSMAFVNLWAIWPIMMIIFYTTTFVLQLIYGPEHEMPEHAELQSIAAATSLAVKIIISISAIGITPILEELLFRGLLQTTVRSILPFKQSAWIAIFLTSVFFVINHADTPHWPILFVLGTCMGYSYEKSGSLIRSIFIHALFNTSSVIMVWSQ